MATYVFILMTGTHRW